MKALLLLLMTMAGVITHSFVLGPSSSSVSDSLRVVRRRFPPLLHASSLGQEDGPTTTIPTTRIPHWVAMMEEGKISASSSSSSLSSWSSWRMPLSWAHALAIGGLAMACGLSFGPALSWAENELSAKYGNAGLDTSLVDQTCLVNHCRSQAQTCLRDDPNCRKGLTCTAKCLGDNACITGCMARYGNAHLDELLQCTIEDHECIKVAILPGGPDARGHEPKSIAPTVAHFDPRSLHGSWYKVVGYNPNYDCYACQRNSFSAPNQDNAVQMDVEFSMPHLLPDGLNVNVNWNGNGNDDENDNNNVNNPPFSAAQMIATTAQAAATTTITLESSPMIGFNDYSTRETMIFDAAPPAGPTKGQPKNRLVSFRHQVDAASTNEEELSYARTAHSEGEMFGLKFWENWYVIGENEPGSDEPFKFIAYNGHTRQNTYAGAFVYARTKELSPASMKRVYAIAQRAGMNPQQFCRIHNHHPGCFAHDDDHEEDASADRLSSPSSSGGGGGAAGGLGSPNNPFRGILASTKISEFFGVEPVAARDTILRRETIQSTPAPTPTTPEVRYVPPSSASSASSLSPGTETASTASSSSTTSARTVAVSTSKATQSSRAWWHELGDYLENPHRHFAVMDSLRIPVDWPTEDD